MRTPNYITLAGIAFIIGCIGLFAVRVVYVKEQANQSACTGRLFQLSRALTAYMDEMGELPPAQNETRNGTRRTWRSYLWSRLHQPSEYTDKAVTAEPSLWKQGGSIADSYCRDFRCPGGNGPFVVVSGAAGLFRDDVACTVSEITDGCANTVAFIEASGAIEEPITDWKLREIDRYLNKSGELDVFVGGNHKRALVFADGKIFRMLRPLSREVLRALITVAGSENVERDELERLRIIEHVGG